MSAKIEERKTTARDVRVDRICLVEELGNLWTDPMKKQVREDMAAEGLELVSGDLAEGALATPNSSTVDVEKFFRMYNDGKISRKDFLASIKVSISEAKKLMSAADFAKIITVEKGNPRLSIVRKKGIDLTLAECIRQIVAVAA